MYHDCVGKHVIVETNNSESTIDGILERYDEVRGQLHLRLERETATLFIRVNQNYIVALIHGVPKDAAAPKSANDDESVN